MVNSGMDSFGHLISDLWIYNTKSSVWQEISLAQPVHRSKTQRAQESNQSGFAIGTLKAPSEAFEKSRKLLERCCHTVCTVKSGQKRMENGTLLVQFTSYIFGGLVKNQFGQLETSNEILVLKTKRIIQNPPEDA